MELAPCSTCFRLHIFPATGDDQGMGMHQFHDDRYFIFFGELLLVLYDDRPSSSTNGLVAKVAMSEYRRQLINIPAGVWHANQNIGSKDVVVVNFPTAPYNHAQPDKFRLPPDTENSLQV